MITLLLERTPDLLPWTTATGWQVIRIDWSAPREVVKSSLGDTSDNSDCVCMSIKKMKIDNETGNITCCSWLSSVLS